MSIDGYGAKVVNKRHNYQPRQSKPPWVPNVGNPNRHCFMSVGRLITIGAKQTVPPGDIKAKIAVCLTYYNGMMHPVHVGVTTKSRSTRSIPDGRKTLLWLNIDVALSATSKEEHGQGRWPNHYYGHQFYAHRENNFQRVKTQPCREVKIQV